MSFKNWLAKGWLVEHRPSPQEISDLLAIADRDLKDCASKELSSDWRLNIAHNAALGLANACLAASGYRASREAHHYRVIQSLAFTLDLEKNKLRKLDAFRKKRNIAGYDRAGTTSEKEAREMIVIARELRGSTAKWMRKKHPKLLLQ